MLKEIFLIDRSVLQFHYSSVRSSSEDDKALLSSGFLSAIQDFSEHARSDALDSFQTENEYFVFLPCPDTKRVLVGVFDKKAPEAFAREALNKIMDILNEVKMPEIEGMQLPREEKDVIWEKIDQIGIQLFSDDRLSSIVTDLLNERTDIPLAFLVDSSDSSVITSFSRPKPLYKENQVRDFLLVHSTLLKSFESLGVQESYTYFVIESDDYATVACNGGRLLSVASGAMRTPVEDVYDAATSICYAEAFDTITELTQGGTKTGEYVLLSDGQVKHVSGTGFTPKANIFISSLAKNVESMFRSLTRRPFTKFFSRSKGSNSIAIQLNKDGDEIMIELYKF
ncbi:MAG: hypothetical protein RTU30_11885 [Candidatus Thorarchaeota archaeon]